VKASACLQLAGAMILTGSHVVAGKLVVRSFPIFFAGGVTLGVTALLLSALALMREKRLPRLRSREWLLLTLQAFTGLFLFRTCMLAGLRLTGAIEAGIILSTTPAVIGLVSYLILREKLTRRRAAAVLLAFIGILAVNLGNLRGSAGSRPLLGSLLLLGTVLGESFFTVIRKILSGRLSPLMNSALVSILGFAMLLPPALFQLPAVDFAGAGPPAWLLLFYYGTFVPFFAFLLWFSGVSRAEVSVAAVFTGFLSISALVLSVLLLHENAAWVHGIGILLILFAVGLSVGIISPQRVTSGRSRTI
jgi:drug/metabolite transporter (DMT)-like permease